MVIKRLEPWDIQVADGQPRPAVVFKAALEELARVGDLMRLMEVDPSRLRGGENEASQWSFVTDMARDVYKEMRRSTSVGHMILMLVNLRKSLPRTDNRSFQDKINWIIELVKREGNAYKARSKGT